MLDISRPWREQSCAALSDGMQFLRQNRGVPQSATNQGYPCALAYGNSAAPTTTAPEQSTQSDT